MKKNLFLAVFLTCSLLITALYSSLMLPFDPLLDESRYIGKERLTDEEINYLRPSYTKYVYVGNPGVDDIIDHDFRWYLNIYDTLIYCEVIGEPKLNVAAASDYIVPIRVISDTENLLIKNKVIYLEIGWEMLSVIEPDVGERFVFMIERQDWGDIGKFMTTLNGAYYVTEEGYVISAFVEKGQYYTGLNIASFMKELKKNNEEFKLYSYGKETEFIRSQRRDDLKGLVGFKSYDAYKESYRTYYTKLNNYIINSYKNRK